MLLAVAHAPSGGAYSNDSKQHHLLVPPSHAPRVNYMLLHGKLSILSSSSLAAGLPQVEALTEVHEMGGLLVRP